ncbi:cytochrome P450 [Bacillus marasmi]|uniref:cytochrome P450 n=1 Tax=Bacillus marasmi TaxID=1926279 RepID=UPI0011CB2AFB|nr:cytochrome P450 [Bacillus marasmi]
MKTKQAVKIKPLTLTSPEFLRDPYTIYKKMRSTNPIIKMSAFKYSGWYVTGYDEAVAILKNTKFQNRVPLPKAGTKYEALKTIQEDMLVFKNQLDHKRLRLIMSKGFKPNAIEGLRTYMEITAHELLEDVKNQHHIDVVADLASPLASQVIAKLLGIPEADRHLFRRWTLELIPTIDFTRSRDLLAHGNETIQEFVDYMKSLIQQRKQDQQNDFISQLIKEELQGETISVGELLSACILLVIAGHETTVNLISNAILCLLKNPEQLSLLRENPGLIQSAVEEVLRFESPTQLTARVAAQAVEVNGTTIQQGEQVYVLLGAANHDPKQYTNPEQFDITRNPNPHIAFGFGSHFCLGAALARLEASVAVQAFLEKFEHINLATDQPKWRKLAGFRALEELIITVN